MPAGNNVEVGVAYRYNHLHGETLATNPSADADGGDTTALSFFLQYPLPIGARP